MGQIWEVDQNLVEEAKKVEGLGTAPICPTVLESPREVRFQTAAVYPSENFGKIFYIVFLLCVLRCHGVESDPGHIKTYQDLVVEAALTFLEPPEGKLKTNRRSKIP